MSLSCSSPPLITSDPAVAPAEAMVELVGGESSSVNMGNRDELNPGGGEVILPPSSNSREGGGGGNEGCSSS